MLSFPSLPIAATPSPLLPSLLSSPAPPKRLPITLATSALPGLPSRTPSPTSLVSSSLPSLFLSSHSLALTPTLSSAPSRFFDLSLPTIISTTVFQTILHGKCGLMSDDPGDKSPSEAD